MNTDANNGVKQKAASPSGKCGFAQSPSIIKALGGPQMEDYPDWDSWYIARQKWVFQRMNAEWKNERSKVRPVLTDA